MLIIQFAIISFAVFIRESSSAATEDDGMSSKEMGRYRIKFIDNSQPKINQDAHYQKFIPEGCYGQKQLQDMVRKGSSKSNYLPYRPEWCNENGFLVPKAYLKNSKPQDSKPPYVIRVYPFKMSDVFRVVIKSVEDEQTIKEVILSARGLDQNNSLGSFNRGRFLPSEGIQLICCSYYDKDVAIYRSGEGGRKAVFYWVHEESTENDFEGSFIFQATVAKSPQEYWVNVTSEVYTVSEFG